MSSNKVERTCLCKERRNPASPSSIHLDVCGSCVCFRLQMRPTPTHNSAQASQIKAFPLNPLWHPSQLSLNPGTAWELGRTFAPAAELRAAAPRLWFDMCVSQRLEFLSTWGRGNEAVGPRAEKRCNKYQGDTHSWLKSGHIGWPGT